MRHRNLLAVVIPLAVLACDDNTAPTIDDVSDQHAIVGVEFVMRLEASDPEDDPLEWSFTSDISSLAGRAKVKKKGDSAALFTYLPIATEAGDRYFDFVVSDGELSSEPVTVRISVGTEGASKPVFIQPIGTGTTLDLEKEACIAVPVEVNDPDSAFVDIYQGEPFIEGATLDPVMDLKTSWSFCPTAKQAEAADRYTLALLADDQENLPPTQKNYLIVLKTPPQPGCPGAAPVISNQTPATADTVVDVAVTAHISDDLGLKYEPLLYYSTTPPAAPPDVSQMTQLTMQLLSGSMKDGTWEGKIPNPVASQPSGSTAQVYYVMVAQDDDDPNGTCDHVTQEPAQTALQITVTNPGGQGGLGLCEPCTADTQCGGDGDNCLHIDGEYFCFKGCTGATDCPDGYYCSYSDFTSIDGAEARQCIPNEYKCDGGGSGGCPDDAYEENDSLQEASTEPPLQPGSYPGLKSCPGTGSGDDEDWFRIEVPADSQIDASILGSDVTDLDLQLVDGGGGEVAKSDSLTSSESISTSVGPGTYYLRVYSWGTQENSYDLTFNQTTASTCQDDSFENDDDISGARLVDLNNPPFISDTNAICAWDDDWYATYMYAGETLYASLTFLQSNPNEDLDLYVYDGNGNNLTGCDEQHPMDCDPNNGQSGSSDESAAWPIVGAGDYYVVVHGWDGSENLYDICISYNASDCPP